MQAKTAKSVNAPCKKRQPRTPTPHTGKSSQERSALCSQIATARERKEFHAMSEQERRAILAMRVRERRAILRNVGAETSSDSVRRRCRALSDSAGHWRWGANAPCSKGMQARQFHVSGQNRASRRQLFSSRGDDKERHAVKPSSTEQFLPRGGQIFSPRGQPFPSWGRFSPREGSSSHRGDGSS